MFEEKHISENRIVSSPGAYSIFGTKENTKPPEINALPLNAVIGNFMILAVNEHTDSYTVTTVTAIVIKAYPTKLDYVIGDTLDYTGLVVEKRFDDGTARDITADCVLLPAEGYETTESGDMTVSVSYNGATVGTFHIVVNIANIAYGDWWTLFEDGTLDIYCDGDMPYTPPYTPWYDYKASITSVVIEDSVTNIHRYAFSDCDALESVTIGSGVRSIGRNAFWGCSSLKSLAIPDNVIDLETYASYIFMNCDALESVTIGSGVRTIGGYLFYKLPNLTNVTLTASGIRVGTYVFFDCPALESVTLDSSAVFDRYAFTDCLYPEVKTLRVYLRGNYIGVCNAVAFYGINDDYFPHVPGGYAHGPTYGYDAGYGGYYAGGYYAGGYYAGRYYDGYAINPYSTSPIPGLAIYVPSNLLEDFKTTWANGEYANNIYELTD